MRPSLELLGTQNCVKTAPGASWERFGPSWRRIGTTSYGDAAGGGSQGPPEAPGGPPGAQGPRTNYRVLLNHSCRVSAPSGTESLAWSPVRISAVIGPESVVSRWEHGGLGIGVTAQPIPRQPKPAQGAPPRRPKRPPRRPKRPPRRPQDGPHAAPLPQGGEEGGVGAPAPTENPLARPAGPGPDQD